MKKSSLLKMKNLPATEEMLAVAREDVPVKVGSGWNTFYRCRYSGFVRSAVDCHVPVGMHNGDCNNKKFYGYKLRKN